MNLKVSKKIFKFLSNSKFIFVVVAILILFSLSLHIVHSNHYHPEEVFGVGLKAVMHGADRNWLFVLMVTSLAAFLVTAKLTPKACKDFYITLPINKFIADVSSAIPKLFHFLHKALRKGIIQTLVYE